MFRSLQVFLLGLTLAMPPLALAQTPMPDTTGFVGVAAGYGDPTSLDGRFGWGADLGMMFSSGLIGSVFYRASQATQDDRESRIDHLGLGADWSLARVFSGPAAGFRGGVRAGASTLDASGGDQPGVTDTEFSFGPALGYDFWNLPHGLTVGGEGDLLFTMGPRQFSTLYILANLRYWF
jgi:hypothetical protein